MQWCQCVPGASSSGLLRLGKSCDCGQRGCFLRGDSTESGFISLRSFDVFFVISEDQTATKESSWVAAEKKVV